MKEKKNFGPDETVIKAQQGDGEAIARLLRDYAPMLRRAVGSYGSSLSEAGYTEEDLMQEASVALSAAVATYKGDRGVTFGAYARRCVRNRLISIARSARRIPRVSGDMPEGKGETVFSSATLEGLGRVLTAYEREVFRLMCLGYKPAESAARLGRDVKSVYNAICRIKAKAKIYKE